MYTHFHLTWVIKRCLRFQLFKIFSSSFFFGFISPTTLYHRIIFSRVRTLDNIVKKSYIRFYGRCRWKWIWSHHKLHTKVVISKSCCFFSSLQFEVVTSLYKYKWDRTGAAERKHGRFIIIHFVLSYRSFYLLTLFQETIKMAGYWLATRFNELNVCRITPSSLFFRQLRV